eukprot:294799_1
MTDYQQLRMQWNVGDKCLVVYRDSTLHVEEITKIDYDDEGEERLLVMPCNNKYYRFEYFIQPIYTKNNTKTEFEEIDEIDINNNLYLLLNLDKYVEYDYRIKWKAKSKVLMFDKKTKKWFIAQIDEILTEYKKEWMVIKHGNITKRVARFDESLQPIISKKNCKLLETPFQSEKSDQQIRTEWKEGSRCMIFCSWREQWILSYIQKINYHEHTLIVFDRFTNRTRSQFSDNIQPFCFQNEDDQTYTAVPNIWNPSNMCNANNSLFVTQGLEKQKENDLRRRWRIRSKLIIFDEEKSEWVNGEIVKIFIDVLYSGDLIKQAMRELMTVKYDDKTKDVVRFCKRIGPIDPYDHNNTDGPKVIVQQIEEAKSERKQINIKLFKTETKMSKCILSEPYVKNCEHLERLFEILRFYSKLDVINNENDAADFIYFCSCIYGVDILNDYIHLINVHTDNLQQINECLVKHYGDFAQCDFKQCVSNGISNRHYNRTQFNKNNKQNRNQDDDQSLLNFFIEITDSLHFYLLHLEDMGLRTFKSYSDDKKINNDEKMSLIDYQFEMMSKKIKEQRQKYGYFDRFNSSKFNINISHRTTFKNKHEKETPYLQTMFDELLRNNELNAEIEKFKSFLVDHEYDTDAIQEDMAFDHDSNIAVCVNNEELLALIKLFVKDSQMISSSFAVGLIFYYWDYYKNAKAEKEKQAYDENINDHSGHLINDLFVNKKYNTFKTEILNYGFINIQQYYDDVILKASKYFATTSVKNIIAKRDQDLHYDIIEGTPLSMPNLISLILYCNFSDLSTHFSSTFRKSRLTEPLSSIKARNSNYWWLSKTLRETVEFFGDSNDDDECEEGPYFCGMSSVMVVPEFCARLCSPTSTSKQLQVATNFCGRNGIILQFNNNADGFSKYLRSFNCSWISGFKEEDEHLYCGGQYRIRLESVRIAQGWKNYHEFFAALFHLDVMLTSGYLYDGKKQSESVTKETRMISLLIDHELTGNRDFGIEIDDYILETFHVYCTAKRTIFFGIRDILKDWKELPNLFLNLVGEHYYSESDSEEKYDENKANKMIGIKDKVFKLFKNLETVHLNGCDDRFSLRDLLSVWNSTKSNAKIIITASLGSWLHEASSSMSKHVKNKKFKMEFTTKIPKWQSYEKQDCLSIERICI